MENRSFDSKIIWPKDSPKALNINAEIDRDVSPAIDSIAYAINGGNETKTPLTAGRIPVKYRAEPPPAKFGGTITKNNKPPSEKNNGIAACKTRSEVESECVARGIESIPPRKKGMADMKIL